MRKVLFLLAFLPLFSLAQTANQAYDAGVEKFKAKNYEGAILNFTECIKISPYYYDAYLDRARANWAIGNMSKVMPDIKLAIEKKPDYYQAFYYKGKFEAENGDDKTALKSLNSGLKIRSNYPPLLKERSLVFDRMGKIDDAIRDLSKGIDYQSKFNKQDPELYLFRGRMLAKKADWNAALKDFSKFLEMNPSSGTAYLERGKVYDTLDKAVEANKDYSEAISKGLGNKQIYFRRANNYYAVEEWQKAAADLSVLINQYKVRSFLVYKMRGICYLNMNKGSYASKDFNKAAFQDRSSSEIQLLMARSYLIQNKTTSALTYLKKAIMIDEKNGEAYEVRGIIYYKQKKFDMALADLDLAVKYRPSAEAYFYRGSLKNMKKNKEAACLDLKEAARMGHKEALRLYNERCSLLYGPVN